MPTSVHSVYAMIVREKDSAPVDIGQLATCPSCHGFAHFSSATYCIVWITSARDAWIAEWVRPLRHPVVIALVRAVRCLHTSH